MAYLCVQYQGEYRDPGRLLLELHAKDALGHPERHHFENIFLFFNWRQDTVLICLMLSWRHELMNHCSWNWQREWVKYQSGDKIRRETARSFRKKKNNRVKARKWEQSRHRAVYSQLRFGAHFPQNVRIYFFTKRNPNGHHLMAFVAAQSAMGFQNK